MLALTFAHPWLLYALPLAAVPIVIHLLNRRRHQRLPWAAMTFLLRAAEKSRRRTRFEQWLVLLLRTLAVVLLVLLCARPRLGSSVFTGERTHHVVVLDDSASMTHRDGVITAYERGVIRTLERIQILCDQRQGDVLTLVLASAMDRPLLQSAHVQGDLPARARERLGGLVAGDGAMDLAEVLTGAYRLGTLAPDAVRTEIHLLTDLCLVDWLEEDGRPKESLRQVLPLPCPLHVLLVGSRDSENLAVVGIRPSGRLQVVGVPIRFDVEIRNQGLAPSEPTEVTFEIDGRSRVSRVVESLGAGETGTVSFTHGFGSAGPHGVRATLAPDRLTKDDSRALVFEVKARTQALIVDGRHGQPTVDTASYYLAAALDPGGDTPSGIQVTVVGEDRFATTPLDTFDMVFLCDVAAPAPEVILALERHVHEGAGLVIFPGARSDGDAWRRAAWREGQGLLPAPFTATLGERDPPVGVVLLQQDHPMHVTGKGPMETLLARGAFLSRHVQILVPESSPTQVLMRIVDPTGPPFLVERDFGTGTVMLFAVGAETRWSRWPITPAFLVLMQDIYRHAARSAADQSLDLLPAETLTLRLDPTRDRPEVVVRSLAGSATGWTFAAEAGAEAGTQVLVPMAALEGLGLFEVRTTALTGATSSRLFARNVPLVEGRLQKATPTGLRAAYGESALEDVSFHAASATLDAGGQDLLRLAAGILLALLVLESFLAMRVRSR